MKCAVCGREFKGAGHNPASLAVKGKCCDGCNGAVILARMPEIAGRCGGRDVNIVANKSTN